MSNIQKTQINSNPKGYIKAVFGPMFSGKTTFLIEHINENKASARVFKPTIDNRYSNQHIVSHNKHQVLAQCVSSSEQIKELTPQVESHLYIDEIQFFDKSIVDVCNELKNNGHQIVVAGLDMDSEQKEFATSNKIKEIADEVINLQGKCNACGAPASFTFCKEEKTDQVAVGGPELYECRCSKCI